MGRVRKIVHDTISYNHHWRQNQSHPKIPDIFPFPTPRLQSAAATAPPAGDCEDTLPYEPTGDWTAPTTEGNGLEPQGKESDVPDLEHDEDEWHPPSDDVPRVDTGDNDEHPGKQDRIPVSGTNYFSHSFLYVYFVFHVTLEPS